MLLWSVRDDVFLKNICSLLLWMTSNIFQHAEWLCEVVNDITFDNMNMMWSVIFCTVLICFLILTTIGYNLLYTQFNHIIGPNIFSIIYSILLIQATLFDYFSCLTKKIQVFINFGSQIFDVICSFGLSGWSSSVEYNFWKKYEAGNFYSLYVYRIPLSVPLYIPVLGQIHDGSLNRWCRI